MEYDEYVKRVGKDLMEKISPRVAEIMSLTNTDMGSYGMQELSIRELVTQVKHIAWQEGWKACLENERERRQERH